jgi:hypothetical protein
MWFLVGLILGALLLGLITWMRSKNISPTWYEWLIGIVGLLLLFWAVQNFFGSIAEFEPTASLMMLLFLGLPSLILLAIAWRLVARRNKSA